MFAIEDVGKAVGYGGLQIAPSTAMTDHDDPPEPEKSRASVTAIVITLLILAWIGYRAWPLYTLTSLARAIEDKDVARVMTHVDVPKVRHSIIVQLLDTHLKTRVPNAVLRGLVADVAGAVVDPAVADLVTPEAMTDFLRVGWPTNAIPDRPTGVPSDISVVTSGDLGSAWRTYLRANFGISRLEIELPEALPPDRRFSLEFRLTGWRWRLVNIRFPEYLRVELAGVIANRSRGSTAKPTTNR